MDRYYCFSLLRHFIFNDVCLMFNYLCSRINSSICHLNCQVNRSTVIYTNLGNHNRWQIITDQSISYLKLGHQKINIFINLA